MVALVAVLAGCAAPPPTVLSPTAPPHVPTPRYAAPKPAARRPPAKPAGEDAQQPSSASPAAPPDAALPDMVAPPAPAPTPTPATVVGLSQAEVRALFGNPASAGEAGPAQKWTYRAPTCSLTVDFFYDVTRGAFFALAAHADPPPEPECLARLYGATHAS